MPACGINHSLTMISWPAICPKAANILKVITLKYCLGKCLANHNTPKLNNAPLKLRAKVGDKNCPISKLLANTRKMLTHAAAPKPY